MKHLFLSLFFIIGGIMFTNQANAKNCLMQNPEYAQTNPDFAEILTNLQEKISQHTDLPAHLHYLVLTEAHIAVHDTEGFKMLVQEALDQKVSPEQLQEAVYQAVPYCGLSHVRPFVAELNAVFQKNGIKPTSQKTTDKENRRQKGYEAQKEIFGDAIDKGYQNAPQGQLHFQELLSENCFGDYYTRTSLNLRERELLTFALLASLGFCEPQLKAHIAGNVNLKTDKKRLVETVTLLLPTIGYPRTLNALAAVNQMIP